MSELPRFSYSSPRRIWKLDSPSIRTRRFTRNEIAASQRFHFFPVRSMSDHSDAANSPLDCYAPSPFAGLSRRISLPQNRERYSPPHPSIRHLPSGQTARPQITRRRPPKLLNRLWVIRQVSHCGKPQFSLPLKPCLPQCTAAPKKPLGFSASAKLASGSAPWNPGKGLSDLCTPEHDYPTRTVENHPPDNFLPSCQSV